jgi:hypothetical protein
MQTNIKQAENAAFVPAGAGGGVSRSGRLPVGKHSVSRQTARKRKTKTGAKQKVHYKGFISYDKYDIKSKTWTAGSRLGANQSFQQSLSHSIWH